MQQTHASASVLYDSGHTVHLLAGCHLIRVSLCIVECTTGMDSPLHPIKAFETRAVYVPPRSCDLHPLRIETQST